LFDFFGDLMDELFHDDVFLIEIDEDIEQFFILAVVVVVANFLFDFVE